MFLTLIVLTAATVDGFPQLAVLHEPQHHEQFLPVVPLPKRSLDYYGSNTHVQKVVINESNPGRSQSENVNFATPPVYTNSAESARLAVEPIRGPNSDFVKRECDNQQGTSIERAGVSNTDKRSDLRAKSNLEDDRTPIINEPERRTVNSRKGDDISINVVTKHKPDVTSSKPTTIPKRNFSSNEDAIQDGTVRNRKKNPNIARNTTQTISSHTKDRKSTTNTSDRRFASEANLNATRNSSRNKNYEINNADRSVNNSVKDATVRITTTTNREPVQDANAFNRKTSDRPVYVENSMRAPAVTKAPGNPNTNPLGSRSGLGSVNGEEEDRWIWNVTETVETTTPDIENRVSFDGGSCPSGKVKVAGMCVDKD